MPTNHGAIHWQVSGLPGRCPFEHAGNGVGEGEGSGVVVGLGTGVIVGEGVGDGAIVGVGDGIGVGVAVGKGLTVGLTEGIGVGVPPIGKLQTETSGLIPYVLATVVMLGSETVVIESLPPIIATVPVGDTVMTLEFELDALTKVQPALQKTKVLVDFPVPSTTVAWPFRSK